MHCRLERRLLRKIRARDLEQRNGISGTAARKEAEVIGDGRLPLPQDAVGDCDGGNDARRVFVDVERAVKMRDARPFRGDLLVVRERGPVILFVEREVERGEIVLVQRLPLLRHPVRLLLKFRKLRLTEERGADHIEEVIEQVFFQVCVLRGTHEIFEQQHLVDGAGDFGDEDLVIRLGVRLGAVGKIRMDGTVSDNDLIFIGKDGNNSFRICVNSHTLKGYAQDGNKRLQVSLSHNRDNSQNTLLQGPSWLQGTWIYHFDEDRNPSHTDCIYAEIIIKGNNLKVATRDYGSDFTYKYEGTWQYKDEGEGYFIYYFKDGGKGIDIDFDKKVLIVPDRKYVKDGDEWRRIYKYMKKISN